MCFQNKTEKFIKLALYKAIQKASDLNRKRKLQRYAFAYKTHPLVILRGRFTNPKLFQQSQHFY